MFDVTESMEGYIARRAAERRVSSSTYYIKADVYYGASIPPRGTNKVRKSGVMIFKKGDLGYAV